MYKIAFKQANKKITDFIHKRGTNIFSTVIGVCRH